MIPLIRKHYERDFLWTAQVTNHYESYLYVSLRNRINDEFRRQTHLCDDEITDANMKPLFDSSRPYTFII